MTFGVGWGPHICDWPGALHTCIHLTAICLMLKPNNRAVQTKNQRYVELVVVDLQVVQTRTPRLLCNFRHLLISLRGKPVIMRSEILLAQCTGNALHALVAGNTNLAGRWVCQQPSTSEVRVELVAAWTRLVLCFRSASDRNWPAGRLASLLRWKAEVLMLIRFRVMLLFHFGQSFTFEC
jgi:hypothetical protein